MKRVDIIQEVRSLTRDLTNSVFRESDIIMFINQGIDRMRQLISQLDGMQYLTTSNQEPIILPVKYHGLLSVFATARCFGQDERNYQASTFMNEFEQKMDEFKTDVENGKIVLVDSGGVPIEDSYQEDYVSLDEYWDDSYSLEDIDNALENFW